MTNKNILIVGCGDIGMPLGIALAEAGYDVWGLRRSSSLPAPINTLCADVKKPETLTGLRQHPWRYVIVTLTPDEYNDQAYLATYVEGLQNILAELVVEKSAEQVIKRLFFISSTSVYQQQDGGWVNESSATEPSGYSGKRMLQAEQLLDNSVIPSTVIRFAGIYGPGRRRLIDQVLAGQGCAKSPPLFTNRIHRDDCVGFLQHLILEDERGAAIKPLYIGVDSEPSTMWEVKNWLASRLGVSPSNLKESAINRRGSKRCSNVCMLESGYQLLFPSYREGYDDVIKGLD